MKTEHFLAPGVIEGHTRRRTRRTLQVMADVVAGLAVCALAIGMSKLIAYFFGGSL